MRYSPFTTNYSQFATNYSQFATNYSQFTTNIHNLLPIILAFKLKLVVIEVIISYITKMKEDKHI